ncbi:MAG: InlB B-repeat-containing protein [Clostridia bacterium]|nr:InlB B-repeat-containing protein [Clostridia bacterium]
MRKRLLLLIITLLCFSVCLVLASCDNPNTDDEKPRKEIVTVNFDTMGNGEIESIQVKNGEKIAKPQDIEKLGYTFEGWYVNDKKWSFDSDTVTDDITLKAKLTLTAYTIEYVGLADHTNPTTYTIEDEFELINGSQEDYDFLCWCEDEALTKPVYKIEKGTQGNLKLYAKMEYLPLEYNLIDVSRNCVPEKIKEITADIRGANSK